MAAVADACTTYGFFQITGHGLSADLIDAMLAANDELFALPLAEKLALTSPPEINRGYSGLGAESLAYSLGVDAPPDLFEAFNVARDLVDEDDPAVAAVRHSFLAPNVWPDELPAIRPVLNAYHDAVAALALTLTRIFATALDMPEDFFVRALPAPDRGAPPDPLRAPARFPRPGGGPAAHRRPHRLRHRHRPLRRRRRRARDRRARRRVVAGHARRRRLRREHRRPARRVDQRPLALDHPPGGPPAGRHRGPALRRSAAFFLDGDHDTLVECLPTCCSADDPPRVPAGHRRRPPPPEARRLEGRAEPDDRRHRSADAATPRRTVSCRTRRRARAAQRRRSE